MTTFARKTFDAAAYLKFRPTYSESFIRHVIDYAKPPSSAVALDLGCGPGQATVLLAASRRFEKVIGVDPSEGMITAARSTLEKDPSSLLQTKDSTLCDIEYRSGNAEDLTWLEDSSVDLITAGQAAHWFDHERAYKELLRILKPGGTVAYWGYGYLFLPKHPSASAKVMDIGLKTLGSYWEPGRKGPDTIYDALPFPDGQGWDRSSYIRHKFDVTDSKSYKQSSDLDGPPQTLHYSISMRKNLDLEGLRSQLKTWSSVHTYMQQHPSEPNIVDTLVETLDLPSNEDLEIEWPIGLMLMKKGT